MTTPANSMLTQPLARAESENYNDFRLLTFQQGRFIGEYPRHCIDANAFSDSAQPVQGLT